MSNDFRTIKYFIFLLIAFLSTDAFSQYEVKGNITAEIIQKKQLGYLLHIPKNTKEKKPLIIFLHGDGEKGTDTEKVKIHGPFKYLKSHDIDAYVLAPQCPENELWDTEMIYRLILKIQKENNIDPNKISITGLSSGGWAVWNLGILHPELFADLVPISGFADLILMDDVCKVKAIPIRIFHGLLDDVVKVEYATEVYKNLRACNAKVSLTIFEDDNHGCWTRVYDDKEIYDWMLQQVKSN